MSNKRPDKFASLALLTALALAGCEERTAATPRPRGPTQEEVLLQRININPSDVEAHLALANHFFDTRRQAKAIPHYQFVLEHHPDNPNVRTDLGTCLLDARRITDARAEFQRVMREHPNHVQAVFNLAVLENGNGQHAEAARLWEQASTMTEDRSFVDQALELAARARQQAGSAPTRKGP